ncbi:MAG: nitroreductase family protein [Flavobacteriaceae bacterium]|nr:nitroreductase family protein [Flavobacteriaceae bacterium]
MAEEKINELKQILRLSPSSINSQPWKFFFISDEKMKNKLAEASFFNEPKIRDASHLVVFTVIDNIQLFEDQINKSLHPGAVGYYNQFIKHQPEETIKMWFSDQVYLALGFFLSACATMGIDSTPMEGIQTGLYDDILQLEDYKTLFAVAIGYRSEDDANQPVIKAKSRLDLDEVIRSI